MEVFMNSKQNNTSKIINNPLNRHYRGLSRTEGFSTSMHTMRKMRASRCARQLKSLLNSMPDFNISDDKTGRHAERVDHYFGVVGELINDLYKLHHEILKAGAHGDDGTDK
jgi:hypothetical protein